MGSGASKGLCTAIAATGDEELKDLMLALPEAERNKLLSSIVKAKAPPPPKKSAEPVKVFAVPPSQNAVGPVMLAMDSGAGAMEFIDLQSGAQLKPEFLALNPYHHVPTLQDGDFSMGEGTAILRYLAIKFKPEYYPVSDPTTCGRIDYAMDTFSNEVYSKHTSVVYPVMGFSAPPEDKEAAAKAYGDAIDTWTKHFLQGKFVCGDKLSIADFKVVPFFFAAMQPACVKLSGFKPSDRTRVYVDDFCAAVAACGFMKESGGFAIAEFMASKGPDAEKLDAPAAATYGAPPEVKSEGKVKILGMPPSQGVAGAAMLAMDAGAGEMEMCDLMSGAHKTPEFLAMNPWHHVPTLKDGTFAMGESCAVLRYVALKYKPEYYPVADPASCGKIDFAMDSFGSEVYKKHVDVVYVTMGFSGPPADQDAANKAYTEALDVWATLFLKGKFVTGDKISIADFKAVPFLFAAMQPGVEKKTGFKVADRIKTYCEDFMAAVPSSTFLKEAGGFSIAEMIAKKAEE